MRTTGDLATSSSSARTPTFPGEDLATMVSTSSCWSSRLPMGAIVFFKLLMCRATVCCVSPPPFMMGDIQENAEYIAYAITTIAAASKKNGGPSAFPLLAWSQGKPFPWTSSSSFI